LFDCVAFTTLCSEISTLPSIYAEQTGQIANAIGIKEERFVENRQTGNLNGAVVSGKFHVLCAESLRLINILF
jgi:hypothetical protein